MNCYDAGMPILQLLKQKRKDILRIAEKYGAKNVRIFGSVSRQEEDQNSDVDFLVEMDRDRILKEAVPL